MIRSEPHPLFQPADALAGEAAQLLLRMQNQNLEVSRKDRHDVVTNADLASEALILDGLRRLAPHASIFSEEAGGRMDAAGASWIVDPLDGTVNYASGLAWFSVTLAYLEQGRTVFGLTHAPGVGIVARYGDHGVAEVNGRKATVSSTASLSDAVISVVLTSHFSPAEVDRTAAVVRRLGQRVRGVRIVVSGALEMALVACGQLDAFVSLKADAVSHAGAMPLVRAAGGLVTNVAGEPSSNEDLEKIATTPLLHEQLLEVLRRD